jgi:MFS family permease
MVLIFVTIFNSILGLSVLFPVLAPLGRQLGLSEFEVGTLSTGYALMQFVLSPLWGRRSDTTGRKPILLVGILGFAVSFLLFAGAAELGKRGQLGHWTLYVALLGCRLLGGAFSSATLPTAQAYVADLTGRTDRTAGMAMVGAAFGLGIVFGPAIGGALSSFGLLAPVYFSAGLACLNAVFVWLRLPEPERRESAQQRRGLSLVAARVWPLLAIGAAVTLSSVAMEQTIAFYYQDRLKLAAEQTARTVGLALVFYGVTAVAVQGFLVRRYRWPPLRLLRGGIPIALIGFCALIFAGDFLSLTIALVIQGFGQSMALPGVTAALSLSVHDHEQGDVAGLNGSSQAFARMLGPLVGTGLYELRPELPYVFSAVLLGVALFAVVVSGRLRRALEHVQAS